MIINIIILLLLSSALIFGAWSIANTNKAIRELDQALNRAILDEQLKIITEYEKQNDVSLIDNKCAHNFTESGKTKRTVFNDWEKRWDNEITLHLYCTKCGKVKSDIINSLQE